MKWKERLIFLFSSIILLFFTKRFYQKLKWKTQGQIDIIGKRSTTNVNDKKYFNQEVRQKLHPWKLWESMVKVRTITSSSNDDVKVILKEMSSALIVNVDVGKKGTQLKAQLTLTGPKLQDVVFKPKRYSREKVLGGTPYEGFDRHNGEIAAFHLDRLLGFFRAPPVVGRKVHLKKEFFPVTKNRLLETFYTRGEDTCFYGKCYYCKKEDSACADGDIMEGSLTIWIPPKWKLYKKNHPWQRTYSRRKASWENNPNYCKIVKTISPYNAGPRLLDLMDTAIFDFLIGNADRHHYEFIQNDETSMVIHLDNGKSFGNPFYDELSILTPLKQCCMLRQQTFLSIGSFISDLDTDLSLSYKLEQEMKFDPVYPILTSDHLKALDRRLNIVFQTVMKCFQDYGKENVLFFS